MGSARSMGIEVVKSSRESFRHGQAREEVRGGTGPGGRALHTMDEAIPVVRKAAYAKFDETVEMAMRLGVDPKHADQMVRGTVVLPHGTGKSKRVLVIAGGEKVKEAEAPGPTTWAAPSWWPRSRKGGSTSTPWWPPRHDARGGEAGEGAGPTGPHAQPQDGHGDLRRGLRHPRDQGGQGGVPRGQDGDRARARWASSPSPTRT
jgi:hypothetical protein